MKKITLIASLLIATNSFAASKECDKAIDQVAAAAGNLIMEISFRNSDDLNLSISREVQINIAEKLLKDALQVAREVCK